MGGKVVFERGVRKFLRLGRRAISEARKNLRRVRPAAGAGRMSRRKHNLDRTHFYPISAPAIPLQSD